MKRATLTFATIASLFVLSAPVTAEVHPPQYVRYMVEVVVDGDVALKSVPVGIPEASTAKFSPSSPRDSEEVVFSITSTYVDQNVVEFKGKFLVKNDGKTIFETPFQQVQVFDDKGSYPFDFNGKTYQLNLTPYAAR